MTQEGARSKTADPTRDQRYTDPIVTEPRTGLLLDVLRPRLAVCRLEAEAAVPEWATSGILSSVSRSTDELSIVCEQRQIPRDVRAETGWRAIKVLGPAGGVEGPLDFSLIGVLASIAKPLSEARISLFSLSTYDTDYILVRAGKLGGACRALRDAGHVFAGDEVHAATNGGAERAKEPAFQSAPGERRAAPQPLERRAKPAAHAPELVEPEAAKGEAAALESAEPAAAKPVAAKPAAETERPPSDPSRGGRKSVTRFRSRDRRRDDEADAADEESRSEGLYSGAIPQHPVETTDRSFSDLGLSAPILRTVEEFGFENPTPIQAGVIPDALAGRDIIGLAETGSGKTAAFVLPIAERLTHGKGVRGVILCPTREIALQTKAFLDLFGKDHELETVCIIGGVKMHPQIEGLRRTPDIIVATPGRLLDHMERRNVDLRGIEELVLDEADHMLDLGFLPQIGRILKQVPDERRTMLFSATMPTAILNLVKMYTRDPVTVDIRPAGHAAQGITHRLYLVAEKDKEQCLYGLLREVEGSTLIFTRRRLHAEWLSRLLEKEGFEVARIHSDRSQGQRVKALKDFREAESRILVATDVAARGLDIPVIQHVINFGLPECAEDYIHRAGRTARGLAKGTVSSIGTWLDKTMVREIESVLGEKIPRCTAPGIEPYREIKRKKPIRRRLL